MDEFFKTRMGHRFYESTMPELVKQLERLNEILARLVRQHRNDEVDTPPSRQASDS